MALLSARGISLSYGPDRLLDNIDLNIEPGDRACIVGRNGAGKSSLLKIIHDDLQPDGGEIITAKKTRISYLPQDVPADITGTVEDIAVSWRTQSANDDHIIGRVLSHLSLEPHAMFDELSGGQKRRALLARALACEPDLLLLDEPTNHLDIDSICWMEDFLLRHCKTFLFVTHDRAFLRRIANRIIDLDRGKLAHWQCDYDTFLVRKADLLHSEQVRHAEFDKKLSKEEAWIRQGIKARRTRNEGRVRSLMRMREDRLARREREGTARLNVQQAERSGRKVIETKSLDFSYPEQSPIVQDLTIQLMRGDKVGVVGPNGSGKTTLLKLFAEELQPQAGTIALGTGLKTIYFDQHRMVLDDEKTVAENAGRGMESITIDGRSRHIISYLQDFLFAPDRARTPVKVLSGGERNRLMLAMLFAQPSNLLIMDEPTNDLDTETLELLEDQLLNYEGTMLMVSHDRAFLDNVVTSILAMESGGIVREYIGSYEDYAKTCRAAAAATKNKKKEVRKNPSPSHRFGFKEKRELNKLPGRIDTMEKEQAELYAKVSDPEYFKINPDEMAADRKRTDDLTEEIEKACSRWEELETLREG